MNNSKESGFYLLSDNKDAFVARLALATLAEKTLDIQYYIIHKDASGQTLGFAILAAADRGVHVRILVDDINLAGRDSRLKMMSQHENIEIRIFNPLLHRNWFRNLELIINLDRAGRRMHNKAFIADNRSAIIGGRNIGDEYFDARQTLNFVDLDLLTIGPIVNDISTSFNDYWQSHWATPVEDISRTRVARKHLTTFRRKLRDQWHNIRNSDYFHSLQHADFTRRIISRQIPFIQARAEFFYDRPDKLCKDKPEKTVHMGPQVMPYFEQAKHSLLIASPYFVPGESGMQWFRNKTAEGVKIKVLTNSLAATDVSAVHAGYKKYRTQLIELGVELYELKPSAKGVHARTKKIIKGSSSASLHAKYIIVDQHYLFTGSANMDPRSRLLNTEIGMFIDSRELAEQASELFEQSISEENSYRVLLGTEDNRLRWRTLKNAQQVIYRKEPDASLARKLGVFLLGLLPIENLL